MNRLNVRPLIRMLGALLLGVAVAGAPALSYAQHSGGHGGGGGGGGGGHFSGGGGHGGGGGGGGHFSGGGAGHFSGGSHFGGYAGGHYMSHGGALAGGHYYSGARGYAASHYGAGYTAGRVSAPTAVRGGFRASAGRYPGRAWGGGYWHGVFWPRCWYYPGFAWFLPVLPFGYATFWWGGVPYYYSDNLYYTWSPADSGYVATTPPPVAGDASDQSGDAGAVGAPGDSAADVYLYPRNGQSDQQMSNDRYECHSWAVGQTGFDPTRGGPQSGNRDDYRRAMISCLDARGYSAR